jgi:hypothetical protein
MNEMRLNLRDIEALANDIIPAEERDAGAASVDAGATIAERVRRGVNAELFADGLATANRLVREKFGRQASELVPAEIHELLGALEKDSPRSFRQFRADVCGLYLSDPSVWKRIGFPGPSTDAGGFPDFDQPQSALAGIRTHHWRAVSGRRR